MDQKLPNKRKKRLPHYNSEEFRLVEIEDDYGGNWGPGDPRRHAMIPGDAVQGQGRGGMFFFFW